MKKGSKSGYSPYVHLPYEMLNSAAWTALPNKAIWVYIELKKQFNYGQGGEAHLVLPFSEVSWKMSRDTFFNAIRTLVEYGFIVYKEKGGLYRRPNVYALSEYWREKSRKIVDKEGREAIRLGLVKKPSHRNNTENLPQFQKYSEGKSND
jgi:hypothetical protein